MALDFLLSVDFDDFIRVRNEGDAGNSATSCATQNLTEMPRFRALAFYLKEAASCLLLHGLDLP
jgi:hypothetical protein